MVDEGESGKGLFHTAGNGRNFRRRRRAGDALDRFAEALSHHVIQEHVDSGLFPPHTHVHAGGDARRAAREIGLNPASGNGMLQRIRKRLGPQAR